MIKYGIYALPDPELNACMQNIIDHYARQLNTQTFVPHLTLHGAITLPEVEVLAKAKQAAANITPFRISTSNVSFSTVFHQCVLARVRPTAKLLAANLVLQQTFQTKEYPPYHPHMSLIYGNLDFSKREKIAREIELSPRTFQVDRMVVVKVRDRDYSNTKIVKRIDL
jgi:2'-5' RNA ligase